MSQSLPVHESLEEIVDPAHTALLVIDVQNDFLIPEYEPMIERLEHRQLLSVGAFANDQDVGAPALPGSASYSNGTYTNDFFIGGVGSAESGGLGALRMGNAARKTAERFSWDAYGDRWFSLLQKIRDSY